MHPSKTKFWLHYFDFDLMRTETCLARFSFASIFRKFNKLCWHGVVYRICFDVWFTYIQASNLFFFLCAVFSCNNFPYLFRYLQQILDSNMIAQIRYFGFCESIFSVSVPWIIIILAVYDVAVQFWCISMCKFTHEADMVISSQN